MALLNPRIKHWLHLIGSGLGIAGIIFVIFQLKTYANQLDLSTIKGHSWALILVLSAIYGGSNLLLASAWWHLMKQFKVEANIYWSIRVYGITQLAKYVPGNIFHLAGRQAQGMAADLPAHGLAKSAFWELVIISITGASFGILVTPLIFPNFTSFSAFMLFISLITLVLFSLKYWFSSKLAKAPLFYLIFLFISGLLFVATLKLVVPDNVVLPNISILIGSYVLAWLAGLVTPGAPAGLGVREAVILFFLGSVIASPDLLLAVLLSRAISVAGDLLFFFTIIVVKENKTP